jgi:hypothetical protein
MPSSASFVEAGTHRWPWLADRTFEELERDARAISLDSMRSYLALLTQQYRNRSYDGFVAVETNPKLFDSNDDG